jgi:hypothetical protein
VGITTASPLVMLAPHPLTPPLPLSFRHPGGGSRLRGRHTLVSFSEMAVALSPVASVAAAVAASLPVAHTRVPSVVPALAVLTSPSAVMAMAVSPVASVAAAVTASLPVAHTSVPSVVPTLAVPTTLL